LQLSSTKFQTGGLNQFTLGLNPLEPNLKNTESLEGDKRPTCWHSLFRTGILAQGFPIAERHEVNGIEIPFELMTALAQVSISMDYENGTILIGHSAMLIPSRLLGNAVQWHYVEASDTQKRMETMQSCNEYIRRRDISGLTKLRTFLGYYAEAHVLLGTQKLLDSAVVKSSGLEKSNSRIELA
jgi:hypothetical protein